MEVLRDWIRWVFVVLLGGLFHGGPTVDVIRAVMKCFERVYIFLLIEYALNRKAGSPGLFP